MQHKSNWKEVLSKLTKKQHQVSTAEGIVYLITFTSAVVILLLIAI